MTTADLERHYADHEAAVAETVRLLTAAAPTDASSVQHLLDQAAAAATELSGTTTALGERLATHEPDRNWRSTTMTAAERLAESSARFLIAIGLWGPDTSCRHLRRTPLQPAVATLALGRVQCSGCNAIEIDVPPATDDDRCDWCGARGIVTFTPVIIQMGTVLVIGEACDHCAERLRPDRA